MGLSISSHSSEESVLMPEVKQEQMEVLSRKFQAYQVMSDQSDKVGCRILPFKRTSNEIEIRLFERQRISVRDVQYIPQQSVNFLSVNNIASDYYSIVFDNTGHSVI